MKFKRACLSVYVLFISRLPAELKPKICVNMPREFFQLEFQCNKEEKNKFLLGIIDISVCDPNQINERCPYSDFTQ
jgi:hypothetical protein